MTGIFDTGPSKAPPASFNMAQYVLRYAATLAEKPALEVFSETGRTVWRYEQIAQSVRHAAFALRENGLEPGDKVLLRLGNSPDFPIVFLGALWGGLVPVPTSAALTQREVDWIAKDLTPALCVASEDLVVPANVGLVTPQELQESGVMDTAVMGDPNQPGYIIYTSGSSGTPRAVLHAHRAIWARRMMYQGWYGLTGSDRVFHAGAFNWTYTLGVGLLDPWAQGATALIRGSEIPNTDLPSLLRQSEASIFAAAPGVYRQVLKRENKLDLPSLRHGLSAGEALSERIRAAWQQATGTEIYEALGMSECSTYISAHPGRQALKGYAGYVQDGRRIAILDQEGTPVAFGTPGTIGIDRRDPGLMLGYPTDPDAEARHFKGEWFDTGDRAVLEADGALQYLGRNDDMMNAGGYRVAPMEVEAAFTTLPGLLECAATEVEIKADTHVIALFYTGTPLDDTQLQAHAEAGLARYKHPRVYVHCDALPHNANGKLNRKALRETFEAP